MLVGFLLKVHSVIPNWGIAIIILDGHCAHLSLFLSLPGVQNMVRMREIKPEIGRHERGSSRTIHSSAASPRWSSGRKHNAEPVQGLHPAARVDAGVWFALYTTLQTAVVSSYNIPFLWFPDLSQSDPLFILPFIIGGTYFVQQKTMPMQGGDPAQQKMMMYMMPIMFTVFMLFLPAGLGVYMFTNSVLAITQQALVEKYA